MSRVINTESAGKDRTRLTKSVVLAIRELMKQSQPDQHSRDLAAFIALALEEIAGSIDTSVQAWEKRGYWVKADRFRMDWAWSGRLGQAMREAVKQEDWGSIAMLSAQVAQKLMSVEVSPNHRLGTPWVGAWEQLAKTQ